MESANISLLYNSESIGGEEFSRNFPTGEILGEIFLWEKFPEGSRQYLQIFMVHFRVALNIY